MNIVNISTVLHQPMQTKQALYPQDICVKTKYWYHLSIKRISEYFLTRIVIFVPVWGYYNPIRQFRS